MIWCWFDGDFSFRLITVIPAKAGIQRLSWQQARSSQKQSHWIPAFAGMTGKLVASSLFAQESSLSVATASIAPTLASR